MLIYLEVNQIIITRLCNRCKWHTHLFM